MMIHIVDGLSSDDAAVLTVLCQAASDIVAFKRPGPRDMVELLPQVTRAAIARVHDGDRVVGEEHFIFAQLIVMSDAALERYDRARAVKLNRAIAAMLPDVQDDGVRAMQFKTRGMV